MSEASTQIGSGLRKWTGGLRPAVSRWFVITATGVRMELAKRRTKILVYLAWTPLIYYGLMFLGVAWLTQHESKATIAIASEVLGEVFNAALVQEILHNPADIQKGIWTMLFFSYYHIPQAILTGGIVGIVGSGLIAQDQKGNAFLLYFSRPISRSEYVLGKLGVIAFFVCTVTLFPAIMLYVVSIGMSQGVSIILPTCGVLFKVLLASIVIIVPSGLMMLLLSSLFHQNRFPFVIWFTIWVMGFFTYGMLNNMPNEYLKDVAILFSPQVNIDIVLQHIFDVQGTFGHYADGANERMAKWVETLEVKRSLWPSLIYLIVLSAGCLAGIMYRTGALIRK
jgi:ABC-type transport system involved in multi-copper enzyme maturation permease subunit